MYSCAALYRLAYPSTPRFLAGPAYSLADVLLTAILFRLEFVGPIHDYVKPRSKVGPEGEVPQGGRLVMKQMRGGLRPCGRRAPMWFPP